MEKKELPLKALEKALKGFLKISPGTLRQFYGKCLNFKTCLFKRLLR